MGPVWVLMRAKGDAMTDINRAVSANVVSIDPDRLRCCSRERSIGIRRYAVVILLRQLSSHRWDACTSFFDEAPQQELVTWIDGGLALAPATAPLSAGAASLPAAGARVVTRPVAQLSIAMRCWLARRPRWAGVLWRRVPVLTVAQGARLGATWGSFLAEMSHPRRFRDFK